MTIIKKIKTSVDEDVQKLNPYLVLVKMHSDAAYLEN